MVCSVQSMKLSILFILAEIMINMLIQIETHICRHGKKGTHQSHFCPFTLERRGGREYLQTQE